MPKDTVFSKKQGPHPQEFRQAMQARYGSVPFVWQDLDTLPLYDKTQQVPKFYYLGSLVHSEELRSFIEIGDLDPFLEQLTITYRDIYGGAPWDEYLICTRKSCALTLSIFDAYGNEQYIPLQELEAAPSSLLQEKKCLNCGANLEFFYSPKDFLQQLQTAFQKCIIATFLFNCEAQLMGFTLGWETTIQEGWKDKFLSGYGDAQQEIVLPYSEYLQEVQEYIGPEVNEKSLAFNSAEWAVSVPGRSSGASLPLYYIHNLTALQAMGRDVPVIGHSLDGSKALSIFC